MRYEWDEAKNRSNQRKHGVSFYLATLVFEDPRCLVEPDHVDKTGEQRWHAIGAAQLEGQSAVLLVVHVYREDRHGEEIIRIISARQASKRELRRYQQTEVDEAGAGDSPADR